MAHRHRRIERGQTLIIALLIMFVLVILGFTFTAIVTRSILNAGRSQRSTIGGDLSRAGAEYAHYQLQYASLGADWRPNPTPPAGIDANGFSRDPDAMYMRQGSGLTITTATGAILDRGGPDGLGPYTRFEFTEGRALVRVRYAPSNFANIAAKAGALLQPGRVRNYLIIESVGRPGTVTSGGRIDPSRLLEEAVKVTSYADDADLAAAMAKARTLTTGDPALKKLIAFASIGFIETARYISDKHDTSRAAEIGFPLSALVGSAEDVTGVGAYYRGASVSPVLTWGGALGPTFGGGSLYSNADLVIHGQHDVFLNRDLGDAWYVNGEINPANANSQLSLSRFYFDGGSWNSDWQAGVTTPFVPNTLTSPLTIDASRMTSRSDDFLTWRGVFRDGLNETDPDGYSRGIARKAPPSILLEDPQGGANRYLDVTRNSGYVLGDRNTGRYGYGRGIYVDAEERGNFASEDERELLGAVRSLPNDWLNPNNPNSQAWQGPYYRPIAPYLRLRPDGFEITRDSRSERPFWVEWTGTNWQTGSDATVQYRIRTIGGQAYMINSTLNPSLIGLSATNLADQDFVDNGLPFNGVLYFEGDVRVRGVIPTDVQISVVSMGTIYVEGSITKGVVTEAGALLNRPSESMAALMARDYVTINTTQFFGPAPGADPQPKSSNPLPDTPSPIELDLAGGPSIDLQAQFLLDPLSGTMLGNPGTWEPYAINYADAVDGSALSANLLVMASADDNGPAFASLDVAALTFADTSATGNPFDPYLFARFMDFGAAGTIQYNAASPFYTFANYPQNIPTYGLGDPNLNSYPKFEVIGFPLVTNLFNYSPAIRKLEAPAGNVQGVYEAGVQDETYLRLALDPVGTFVPKNFLFARTAIAPHDVRIEAAMYAEEGSFFVIPGPWFNPNVDDTRERFEADVAAVGLDMAQRNRFELYGAGPNMPFYGEPLDVRVSFFGAIGENMPPPMSQQSEWLKKWGWIPRELGGSGNAIPAAHYPPGLDPNVDQYAPNLTIVYDPVLATGSANGSTYLRVDAYGNALPPVPRLPVSPTLAYFGEVNP